MHMHARMQRRVNPAAFAIYSISFKQELKAEH